MADLRAGLVGLGEMGRHHARVLAGLPGVELVGIADPAGGGHPTASVVEDLEQLMEMGLDLCVVATPTTTHLELGRILAANGVASLVEKPLAATAEEASALADAFETSGTLGCVGHIERYNPALRDMRRRLAAGELGEVYQIATRRQGPFPARVGDVGVVLDLATHDLDLTMWVTGSSYVELQAQTAHRSGRDTEDLVAVVGRLDDGTVVNHLVNWLSPLKERVVVVTGERGCFSADLLTADLTFHANGVAPIQWDSLASFQGVVQGDVTTYALAKPEPLSVELAEFVAAVRGRPGDVVPMRAGAEVVSVARRLLGESTGAR